MDKGISMNGEPNGGMSMNLPVAQGKPIISPAPPIASAPPAYFPDQNPAYYPFQNPAYPMQEQEKVGSNCCGCCCDFRRAVIILDCILILYSAMVLLALAFPVAIQEKRFELMDINDDQVQGVLLEMTTVTQIVLGCGVVALAIPAYGAKTYNTGMIAFGIAWFVLVYIAQVVVDVVYTREANDVAQEGTTLPTPFTTWIGSGIFTVLYIYPHAGLINEIKSGIMSAATYPREEYSCCCGRSYAT